MKKSIENGKQLLNNKVVKHVNTKKIKIVLAQLVSRKEIRIAILVAALLLAKNLLPNAKARDIGTYPMPKKAAFKFFSKPLH